MMTFRCVSILILISFCGISAAELEIDSNGYIIFCPCMGRFGNQMDQFLGALAFAKSVDRTLVLPHLVEYPAQSITSIQIPFQKYFQVEPLREYTRVIPMDEFMTKLADKVWPKGKRTGNPFGPFWDKFKIDFDADQFYAPLGFDSEFADQWKAKFPSQSYAVLAFTGAPGAFPVSQRNTKLQKYVKWSDDINSKAEEFIRRFKTNEVDKFVAIHLRNGVDFKRACEHAKQMNHNFFASAQCLGYNQEFGKLTEELCDPPEKLIIKQLSSVLKRSKAKHVYIATDDNAMMSVLKKNFKKINFIKYDGNDPHLDLAIIGKADIAIVNCISTFSAFAKRQRDAEGKETEFWAYKPNTKNVEL